MTGLAGVVLCGGRSRRMGVDKALIDAGGEPLVARTARTLAEVAEPVFLAPGTPGRLETDLGYEEVEDERPNAGPLGGLVAAMAASPHPLVAALAVDMPFASPAVFRLLRQMHAGEDVVLPVTASGPEPLHAVYSTSCLGELRAALAQGRLGLRSVLKGLSIREVLEVEWRLADPGSTFALNLNRVEDLELLKMKGTPLSAPFTSSEDVRRRAP
jgi:molybdenum cofactor guanylyltransferase